MHVRVCVCATSKKSGTLLLVYCSWQGSQLTGDSPPPSTEPCCWYNPFALVLLPTVSHSHSWHSWVPHSSLPSPCLSSSPLYLLK